MTAREITYNNFEISLVVFMPNITTNHAITYTNPVRKQEKSLLYKLTLRSRFTLSCAMSRDWPVNTDFKLDYNHKLHKKLPNQTPTYVLLALWDLNTILCTISRILYIGGSECL